MTTPTTPQQQPQGIEYQLGLLRLEVIHYRDTGRGAQHLVNAVFRVLDQQQTLTQAREALESIEQIPAVPFTRDQLEMAGRTIEAMQVLARAALAALEGRAQP